MFEQGNGLAKIAQGIDGKCISSLIYEEGCDVLRIFLEYVIHHALTYILNMLWMLFMQLNDEDALHMTSIYKKKIANNEKIEPKWLSSELGKIFFLCFRFNNDRNQMDRYRSTIFYGI
jgi:hypothetical protein